MATIFIFLGKIARVEVFFLLGPRVWGRTAESSRHISQLTVNSSRKRNIFSLYRPSV